MEREFDSQLVESLPDALIGTDAAFRIRAWNPAAERTYGFSAGEVLGASAVDVLDSQIHGRTVDEPRGALQAGGQWCGEVSQRRKDGSRVLVIASASAIVGPGGAVTGYVAICREATALAEQRPRALDLLRRAAMAANGASDVDEALRSCLDEVCRFLDFPIGHAYGLSPETGRLTSTGVWHLADEERDGVFMKATLRLGKDAGAEARGLLHVLETKCPAWFPDAAEAYGPRARFSPLGLPDLAVALPVLVGAEVTHILEFFHGGPRDLKEGVLGILEQVGTQLGRVVERSRADRQRVYADALERSNRELRLFAHVASHDLQEPLRMVTSFLELLRDRYGDKLDARGKRYVAHAVDGAQRMMALIRSLLEYSRLETRSNPPTPVSLDLVLDEALDNLRQVVRERAVVITRGAELPVVLADETQLVQLFQNLISNAVKFCEQKPPRVHVEARRAGTGFHFSVRDNGIGIDMKYSERVFEIFQRLHTRDEYPGTGVGLAICRRIVERHGGKVWLESAPGKGTQVHFSLPDGLVGSEM